MNARFAYSAVAAIVVIVGLASRRYRGHLPAFLAEYAGDTLRAALSLALAFLIEISQLYHAPWIDSIRQTTLGGLVLGFGFLWTDLVCYSVGVASGLVVDSAIAVRIKRMKGAQQ